MNGGGSRHCGGDIIRSILVMDDSLNRISPLADEAAKADVTSSHQPATKGTCSLRRKERKDEGAVNEDNSIMKTRKRPVNFSSIGPSLQCPVCEVFLRPSELEKHCQIEVDRLHKSEAPSRKKKGRRPSRKHREDGSEEPLPATSRARKVVETVERNVYRRSLRVPSTTPGGLPICPMCSQVIHGDVGCVNEHIDECLLSLSRESHSNSSSEEDGFDEYTWAGETRIRATSMVPIGLLSSTDPVRSGTPGEEDLVLDIEGDGGVLGKAQYTEADLIPCTADEPKEERQRQALRGAVLSHFPVPKQKRDLDVESPSASVEDSCEEHVKTQGSTSLVRLPRKEPDRLLSSKTMFCLVCMDSYKTPVVSVNCWHVYCEVCWLRALGAKKVCPKCNAITAPGDLRKIYV